MKHIIIASILSVMYPGIGQLYNKERRKGILLVVLELLLGFFDDYSFIITLLFIAIWIYGIVDALLRSIIINREGANFLKGRQAVLETGIVLILALSLTVISNMVFSGQRTVNIDNQPPQKLNEVQQEAQIYLKRKYNQSFEVGTPKYTSDTGEYNMVAYPKEKSNIKFVVYKTKTESFDDTYLNKVWSVQSENELKPVINDLYSDVWIFSSEVGVDQSVKTDVLNNEILRYEDLRTNYPKGYAQHVSISVIKNLSKKNKDKELEKAFKLVRFLKERNIDHVNLSIAYYNDSLPEEAKSEKDNLGDYYDYLEYEISIDEQTLPAIKDVKDIESYLIKLN